MKIVIFGLGSIGKRHAKILLSMYPGSVYVYRSGIKRGNEFNIPEIYSLEEVWALNPDVALISNPTNLHIKTALLCAEKKINLFIEKPLSNNNEGLEDLRKTISQKNITAYVGYCLRFHPGIEWLKKHLEEKTPLHVKVVASSYLPSWRKDTDHLTHYSAYSSKGGGVLFELSHEIDYLEYLFGSFSNIKGKKARVGNVTHDAVDVVDFQCYFGNVLSNVHLNYCSHYTERTITVIFNDHTVIIDLVNHKANIINLHGTDEIKFEFEINEMYQKQLVYYFNNFKKGSMMNNFEEASKIFVDILKMNDQLQ